MTVLVSSHLDGHRRDFVALFSMLAGDSSRPAGVALGRLPRLFSREPLLFLMIEDSPVVFFVYAFIRALLGLRTAGFLFRPSGCVQPESARLALKRALLRLMKRLPSASAITLLPSTIEPRFAELARYSIYDPQLWDLPFFPRPSLGSEARRRFLEPIDRLSNGRRVLVALGLQDGSKGFEYLCRVWLSSEQIRRDWLFVVAGRCDPSLGRTAENFRRLGGILIDRFIDDAELQALYARADLVWCCYAPEYDQASGIFGRAFQYGVPVAVRADSYIQRVAADLGHPHTVLDWGTPDDAAARLSAVAFGERSVPTESIEAVRRFSLESIQRALGSPRAQRATGRAAWNIAEVLVTAVTMFAIYKLVVAQLGVAALGVYSLVLATTSFARIGDLGMAAGLARFVARAQAGEQSQIPAIVYVETALIANLILYAFVAVAIVWPVAHALQWALHGSALASARALIPYAAFSFAVFNISNVPAAALTGFHRSEIKSRIAIFGSVTQLIVSWAMVRYFGLIGLAFGQIAQNGAMMILGWALTRRIAGDRAAPWLPRRMNLDALREMFGFGIRLQSMSLVSLAYEPLTKFLMSALAGPAVLGLFEMAYRVVMQTRAIILAPGQNLVPMFAAIPSVDTQERQRLYESAVAAFSVAGGLALLSVIALSPFIAQFLLHRVSLAFTTTAFVLSVGWFVNIVSAPAYLMATADGRIRWNMIGTAIASFGSPIFGYVLWNLFGVIGIVGGFSLATGLGAATLMIANARMVHLVNALPSLATWRQWTWPSGSRFAALFEVRMGSTGAEAGSALTPD